MITAPAVEAYAEAHCSAEPPGLQAVAAVTRELLGPRAGMMVGRLEGGFLAALVALSGARTILEIGTFTGYSALSMATAMGQPAMPMGAIPAAIPATPPTPKPRMLGRAAAPANAPICPPVDAACAARSPHPLSAIR